MSAAQGPKGSIAALLVALAQEPELLSRFRSEPDAVMDEYGLSGGQRDIVGSGDLERLREAIDYEYATGVADVLPGYGAGGGVAMVVTWRPRPTWGAPTWGAEGE